MYDSCDGPNLVSKPRSASVAHKGASSTFCYGSYDNFPVRYRHRPSVLAGRSGVGEPGGDLGDGIEGGTGKEVCGEKGEVMNTGRELDALVAEKVMGLLPCSDPVGRCGAAKMTPCQCWGTPDRDGVVAGGELASYSTDISTAWQVVEKLALQGRALALQAPGSSDMNEYYQKFNRWTAEFQGQELCPCVADTAPLVICLAALKAVGVEVPE